MLVEVYTKTKANFSFQPNFALNVGAFNGTIDNSLTYHNGMKFSTKDKNQDIYQCAVTFGFGAWWYNACHSSNLNGPNFGHAKADSKSMCWYGFPKSGQYISLKTIKMALRKQ